jgi:ParB-like chromosome segregation protein Spo0J
MKITWIPLNEIVPYEGNPRTIGDDAVEAVANSIQEFGWQQPIVIDSDKVIISGHVRRLAAIKLGLEKVPVLIAKDLSPEKIKAFRIADNKSHELAEWDFKQLLTEITAIGESVDLTLLGFEQDDLDQLLNPSAPKLGEASKRSTAQLTLKFGKYTVPLDESEFGHLVRLLTAHETKLGTRFGFVAALVEQMNHVPV